jgi:hypothetical protein
MKLSYNNPTEEKRFDWFASPVSFSDSPELTNAITFAEYLNLLKDTSSAELANFRTIYFEGKQ